MPNSSLIEYKPSSFDLPAPVASTVDHTPFDHNNLAASLPRNLSRLIDTHLDFEDALHLARSTAHIFCRTRYSIVHRARQPGSVN